MMARVEEHIASCKTCASELERIEKIISHVEAIQPINPPPGLWNGVQNRITVAPTRTNPWRGWLATPRRALVLGIGTAAIAVTVFLGVMPQHTSLHDAGSSEFVAEHVSAASQDVFADRIGLNLTAAAYEGNRNQH